MATTALLSIVSTLYETYTQGVKWYWFAFWDQRPIKSLLYVTYACQRDVQILC